MRTRTYTLPASLRDWAEAHQRYEAADAARQPLGPICTSIAEAWLRVKPTTRETAARSLDPEVRRWMIRQNAFHAETWERARPKMNRSKQ